VTAQPDPIVDSGESKRISTVRYTDPSTISEWQLSKLGDRDFRSITNTAEGVISIHV
jgi:hypothetical protein